MSQEGLENNPAGTPQAQFIEEVYPYHDESGQERYRKVRLIPKAFYQEARGPDGVYVRSLNGVRRLLYRLPELLGTVLTTIVFLVEGEKDADRLASHGLVATTAGGASDWQQSFTECFRGRPVVILPDNDFAGKDSAEKIAASLYGTAASVKVVDLPGLRKGGDVSDFLDSGKTMQDLLELVEATPEWRPTEEVIDVREADDDPHRLAEVYLIETSVNGETSLKYWKGGFWLYSDGHYSDKPQAEIVPSVNRAIRDEFLRVARLSRKEVKPVKRHIVNDTIEALKAKTLVSSAVEMPIWLGEDSPWPASEVVATRTSIVHIPSLVNGEPAVLPATPRLFTVIALRPDFDVNAPAPVQFLRFVHEIFQGDRDSIYLLQEFFGYTLTADTKYHQMLFLFGPTRSGKGVLSRVLTALLGAENVAAPTLSSLATTFGLSPLMDCSLAIVSDARLSGRHDLAQIVENLLTITGDDRTTINVKYRAPVTVKLPIKFMIVSNELPRLSDASAAIADRFLILQTRQSFLGREDRDLERRLLNELPGILLWAIAGAHRLASQGRFTTPPSHSELRQEIADLASPIQAFLRERCELSAEYFVQIDVLFASWKRWADESGNRPGSIQSFGRNLRAAFPDLQISQRREANRQRVYEGIRLRDSGTLWDARNGSSS